MKPTLYPIEEEENELSSFSSTESELPLQPTKRNQCSILVVILIVFVVLLLILIAYGIWYIATNA